MLAAWALAASCLPARAQILPPGLNGARTSTWVALGISQEWSRRFFTVAYVGASAQSTMGRAALDRLGIFVLNQETYFDLTRHWRFAYCTSFREQGNYALIEPYDLSTQGLRHELRHYVRLIYRHNLGTRWQLVYTARPEYRSFYKAEDKGGGLYNPAHQFRTRLQVQANYALETAHRYTLMLGDELVAASTQSRAADGGYAWTPYQYGENRVYAYMRITPNRQMYVDLGVMNQWWLDGARHNHYTAYAGADLILRDPFGRLHK